MSGLEIGLWGFVALLVLLALRIPIGVAMLVVGMAGYASIGGVAALLNHLKTETYWRFSSYDLSVIPLFMLMGQFAAQAGLSKSLFRAAAAWIGHWRGGIAMAALGGCAGFSTISGSSIATAATMGKVALPELERYRYSGALATGSIAAGGTLGILIPPSIVLIIYAIMVQGSVVALFQAALIPGIIAALGYILTVGVVVRLQPQAGPAGPRASRAERLAALAEIWPVLLIFVLVMGGIYVGFFTPTEGAGVGAAGTFLVAVFQGGMRWCGFVEALIGTAETTGMIYLIILGAAMFSAFLGFTQLPIYAADWFRDSGLPPLAVLLTMLALYVVLGCVMDSLSMILLTVPIFWPIISGLDFGMPQGELLLWFGILSLIVVEVGLITPPVGLNVFVINSLAKDVPMLETYKGVLPFLVSDLARVALIMAFPGLALALPGWLA